jgi:hypothetical protein
VRVFDDIYARSPARLVEHITRDFLTQCYVFKGTVCADSPLDGEASDQCRCTPRDPSLRSARRPAHGHLPRRPVGAHTM